MTTFGIHLISDWIEIVDKLLVYFIYLAGLNTKMSLIMHKDVASNLRLCARNLIYYTCVFLCSTLNAFQVRCHEVSDRGLNEDQLHQEWRRTSWS